jgi:hypothetical protein
MVGAPTQELNGAHPPCRAALAGASNTKRYFILAVVMGLSELKMSQSVLHAPFIFSSTSIHLRTLKDWRERVRARFPVRSPNSSLHLPAAGNPSAATQVLSSVHAQFHARHQVPHRAGGIAYIHLSASMLDLTRPGFKDAWLNDAWFSAIFKFSAILDRKTENAGS